MDGVAELPAQSRCEALGSHVVSGDGVGVRDARYVQFEPDDRIQALASPALHPTVIRRCGVDPQQETLGVHLRADAARVRVASDCRPQASTRLWTK